MGGGARVWGSVSRSPARGATRRSQTFNSSVFTFVNDKPPFKVLIISSTSTFSYESLQYACRSFFLLMLQLILIKAYVFAYLPHYQQYSKSWDNKFDNPWQSTGT
jgi:hypothetical protein